MKKLNVLILEDDLDVQSLLRDAMEVEGYTTVSCSNVQAFQDAKDKSLVDLYLIDIHLPDGDGLDVVRVLRTEGTQGIILISGRGEEIDTVLGLELGADDYIVKPFRVRELRARIKSVVRRLRAETPGPAVSGEGSCEYVVQGIRINNQSRTVWSEQGDRLLLTTLEFDLLLALTSPPNRVLSRDQIMDKVRGPNWAAYDRTVDGLVSRLRSKLFGDDTGHEKIRTIRGVGYMFSDDTRAGA